MPVLVPVWGRGCRCWSRYGGGCAGAGPDVWGGCWCWSRYGGLCASAGPGTGGVLVWVCCLSHHPVGAGDRLQELLHSLPERAGAAPWPCRLPPLGDLPAGLLPDALPAHRGGLSGLLLPPPPPGWHGQTVALALPKPLGLTPLCCPRTAPGPWGPAPIPHHAPLAAAGWHAQCLSYPERCQPLTYPRH